MLLDLIRLSQNQTIICDCHLTVDEAATLTLPSRIAFLIKEPSHLVDDYCNRPDHQDFSNYINSASDPESAKTNCNATLKSLNGQRYEQIKQSTYFWIDRCEHCTVDKTVRRVAEHFQFAG